MGASSQMRCTGKPPLSALTGTTGAQVVPSKWATKPGSDGVAPFWDGPPESQMSFAASPCKSRMVAAPVRPVNVAGSAAPFWR